MIALHAGPTVFAVEDHSAQLTWRRMPIGPVRVECGPTDVVIESDGGPGVLDLRGLSPDTAYDVRVATADGRSTLRLRTLTSPPGEELFRFATISDVHFGTAAFGVRKRMVESPGTEEHPVRCARSALADLLEWGAARLVIKGDLVDRNTERAWNLAGRFVESVPIPCDVLPGNHEFAHGDRGGVVANARRHGIDLVQDVEHRDLPGIRLVLMNSAVDGRDVGRWSHLGDGAAAAARGTTRPVMLLVHHHPQRTPVPTFHPPGIDSVTVGRFLTAINAANPRTIGSSGHTHRHRLQNHHGVPWSEVGSPKDYPGAWAGYVVHEGGIRQVVRRVSAPDCLHWLDRTRHAAGGVWGLWSPGRLSDRCFTHVWPRATPRGRPARGDTSP